MTADPKQLPPVSAAAESGAEPAPRLELRDPTPSELVTFAERLRAVVLPQRTLGAALADTCSAVAGMRGIPRCETGHTCDWHEARRLLREGECGCCIGRYGTCRNRGAT